MNRIQQCVVALSILSVVSGAFAKKDNVRGQVRRRTQEVGRRRHPKGVLRTYQQESAAGDNFEIRSVELGHRNQTIPPMMTTKAKKKKKKEKNGDDKKSKKSTGKKSKGAPDEGDDLFVGVVPVWSLQGNSNCSGFYDVNDICHELPDYHGGQGGKKGKGGKGGKGNAPGNADGCETFDYLGNCKDDIIHESNIPPETTDVKYDNKPNKADPNSAPTVSPTCATYDFMGNCRDDIILEDDVPPEPTDDYYENKPTETNPPRAPTISPTISATTTTKAPTPSAPTISPTVAATTTTKAPTPSAPTISPTISATTTTKAPTASSTRSPTIQGIDDTRAPISSSTTLAPSTSSPTMENDDVLGTTDDVFPQPPTGKPISRLSTPPVSSLGPTPWPTEITDDTILAGRIGAGLREAPDISVARSGKKNEKRVVNTRKTTDPFYFNRHE